MATTFVTFDNNRRSGTFSDKDPLDYGPVCRNHRELVSQIGDYLVSTEELYSWDIWFIGPRRMSRRQSYKMRAFQMETNLLDYYPGLKIFHKACDCNIKPDGIIIIIIKVGCPCWINDNNIYLFDVIDANGGGRYVTNDNFYSNNGVIIAQTRKQRELYQSRGYETFVIEHHTTLTMKQWKGNFTSVDKIRYPDDGELFHVGMTFSGGGTDAESINFDWNTTEFKIFSTPKFHPDIFLWFHAALVWMKNRADELHNLWTSLYKGPQRATSAACLGIPVLLHSGLTSHLEFSTVRTDQEPYIYLTDEDLQVRKFVDLWVADRSLWQKAKSDAYELARCYHSELIVDMYVRVFSYLIRRKIGSD